MLISNAPHLTLHAGAAMSSWAYVEAARFIGSCFVVGAVLGFIGAVVRGERHG